MEDKNYTFDGVNISINVVDTVSAVKHTRPHNWRTWTAEQRMDYDPYAQRKNYEVRSYFFAMKYYGGEVQNYKLRGRSSRECAMCFENIKPGEMISEKSLCFAPQGVKLVHEMEARDSYGQNFCCKCIKDISAKRLIREKGSSTNEGCVFSFEGQSEPNFKYLPNIYAMKYVDHTVNIYKTVIYTRESFLSAKEKYDYGDCCICKQNYGFNYLEKKVDKSICDSCKNFQDKVLKDIYWVFIAHMHSIDIPSDVTSYIGSMVNILYR